MSIQLLFFGISADLVKANSLEFSLIENSTIKDLKVRLKKEFPKLKNLEEFALAINENYADDGDILSDGDTVAIIPPVSGG